MVKMRTKLGKSVSEKLRIVKEKLDLLEKRGENKIMREIIDALPVWVTDAKQKYPYTLDDCINFFNQVAAEGIEGNHQRIGGMSLCAAQFLDDLKDLRSTTQPVNNDEVNQLGQTAIELMNRLSDTYFKIVHSSNQREFLSQLTIEWYKAKKEDETL